MKLVQDEYEKYERRNEGIKLSKDVLEKIELNLKKYYAAALGQQYKLMQQQQQQKVNAAAAAGIFFFFSFLYFYILYNCDNCIFQCKF